MHIRTIPYHLVSADHVQVQSLQDTLHPTTRSQRFNTAHHTRLAILPIVPETNTFTHKTPPWTAYRYTLWHPLIVRSQGIRESHVVQIPSFLYHDLMRCHAAWLATNRVPRALVAEAVEAWQSTKGGKELMGVLDGEKDWFIRLDQMSPKDSAFGGTQPSTSFEDVVTKICTSMRAWGCLQREAELARRREGDVVMQLVLNPWDEAMDPRTEFRVFVAPPAARDAPAEVAHLRVTAVSQYRWSFPFERPLGCTLEATARAVCRGADEVLVDVKKFVIEDMGEDMRNLLLEYGFSFDIALQRDGTVRLVEVNPFGALSGCGACLFNWVRDGRVLYGLEDDVEFIVTLDQMEAEGASDREDKVLCV